MERPERYIGFSGVVSPEQQRELSGVNVGIAGGLNGKVIREDLSPWFNFYGFKYPDLSWDAEGQLHLEREDGTRPIAMWAAEDYIYTTIEAHEVGRYN